MIKTFIALALAAPLMAPAVALAQQAAPQRYAVELQLTEAGKDVVVAHTFVAVGGAATMSLAADNDTFDFSTTLDVEQGDGADDRLVAEVNLVRNGEEIAAPRLMMKRSGSARYEVGTEGVDVVRVTIRPAS